MQFLKKVTTRQLWIYIGVAFFFDKILNYILLNPLIDVLQAFYVSMPTALQKLLYSASDSLSTLDLTSLELSVLFAVSAVEKLGMLIEISMIGALLWLVYRGINKKYAKNKPSQEGVSGENKIKSH